MTRCATSPAGAILALALAASPAVAEPVTASLSEDGGDLPLATPEVPQQRLYAKIDDEGGRAEGRQLRRRDGDYLVWELESGTVVRYRKLDGRRVAEDHVFDAGGWPSVTVTFGPEGAPASATLRGGSHPDLPLAGWTEREVPGARIALPEAPRDRPGGGAQLEVLGGELEFWREAADDPHSDAFRDGLVAGCGCFVVDRATTWIDGAPGVRYRLLVPGGWPRDAVDLWAVQRGDALWLMSFRVSAPADPVAALAPGRVLAALVKFEDG
jgi:hypothetical protein